MAGFYTPTYKGYSYKNDENDSSSSSGSQKKSTTSKSGFYTPSYSAYGPTKKEQTDLDAKKRLDELAKQEKQTNKQQSGQKPWWQNAAQAVGNFAAASNEKLLGGLEKGGVQLANEIGSGFNSKEADKRTADFLRTTNQTNKQGNFNATNGLDRNSASFKAGQVAGNVQKTGVDIASLAIPAFGAEKVVRGTKLLSDLAKAGKVKNAASAAAGMAVGSAAGTGIGAVQDVANGNEKDLAKNAAVGTIADVATPVVGKVLGKGLKAIGADKAISKIFAKSTKAKKASQEASQAAEDAAIRKQAGVPDLPSNASQSLTTSPNEVVQVIDKNSGKKTFYRIPTDQRDEIVNSIDNARNGTAIAGKDVNGAVTHVTARSPEDMSSKGFEDGGVYGSKVGTAVENAATPEGQTAKVPGQGESRYASKTLPESDFVDAGTKAKLGASYDKTTNASRADQSLLQLDTEGIDNFATKVHSRLDDKHITDQTVFDAQAAAQSLEKRGDEASLQNAAEIYNKLSTHLTKAGQTVQAAAIMARQTPEGLSYYAQKQFKKAGVEFTPELQKQLKSYVDDVKNAAPKSNDAAIARDNVQYFIASHTPSNTKDKVLNFWRAGLLTSPTTTAGAIAGNTAQALQRNLITDPVATLADLVTSVFTGKRAHAAASIGSSAKGTVQGIKTLGSKQYRKTGFNPIETTGETKYNTPRSVNYGDGLLGKATGGYVNGVYKLMGSADLPFRNAAYTKTISSLANSEAINKGLKGSEKKAFVDDFMKNPPTDALNTAKKESEAAVFGNETELGKAAQKLSNSFGGLGQILIPFAKVPSAVATKVVTSTPLGTAHEIVKQLVNVKNGKGFDQRAFVNAIGEGTTGVPIIGAGYALGNSGAITGGYPSTQAERDQWDAEGKKPNSIRIGDKWYSLNYIQPFATLLATGAKAAEAEKSGLDVGEAISQATAAAGQSVMSQSFLAGLSNAIDAVKNPADFGSKFVANTASGIVPNFIRAAAGATDPLKRDANGAVEGFVSGIPGLRESLNPKLDANNEPIANNSSFADQYLNPLKPTPANNTQDSQLLNGAIIPAKNLKAVRMKSINQLLARGQVNAAQRKIDEYNQQAAKVISPYLEQNINNLSDDQRKQIEGIFLGQVWVNKKGKPTISSRKDLPK